MGVRLSGGIGPLRVSMSPGRSASGLFALGIKSIYGMFVLMWWLLYFGCYWPVRLVYWDLPRAVWRWWQRRQAAAE